MADTTSRRSRPDVLDPALLRPGRFDRQAMVPLPDWRDREGILPTPATCNSPKTPLSSAWPARPRDSRAQAAAQLEPGLMRVEITGDCNRLSCGGVQ